MDIYKLADTMTMPFGIHKGKAISELPTPYLKYLLEQDWFVNRDNKLVLVVEAEYKFRKEWGK
jgi:uncharacterized protein (DUF3820 family)